MSPSPWYPVIYRGSTLCSQSQNSLLPPNSANRALLQVDRAPRGKANATLLEIQAQHSVSTLRRPSTLSRGRTPHEVSPRPTFACRQPILGKERLQSCKGSLLQITADFERRIDVLAVSARSCPHETPKFRPSTSGQSRLCCRTAAVRLPRSSERRGGTLLTLYRVYTCNAF